MPEQTSQPQEQQYPGTYTLILQPRVIGALLENTKKLEIADTTAGSTVEYSNGTVTASSFTIDWRLGSNQYVGIGANTTVTFIAPNVVTKGLLLRIQVDGTGNRTLGWPTMKWSGLVVGAISTAANKESIANFYYNKIGFYGFGVMTNFG